MHKQGFYIDLDSISFKEKSYITHSIHPYPAKYIPQIPASIIEYLRIPAGSKILDPFCGSGTTLVEASIRGINSIGIDSNPIGCLVSKVKSTVLSNHNINTITGAIDKIKSFKNSMPENITEMLPSFLNRDHWFQQNMLHELTAIKSIIDEINDIDASDFLKVAMSSIIVKVSNQESDTRWAAKQKNLPDGYAIDEFCKKSLTMLEKLKEYSLMNKANTSVYNTDSRNIKFIADDSVDCAITSPPYMNSYDYYLYHKLRMYWLGYDHYEVQAKEIGSRNKHCDNGKDASEYFDSMRCVCSEVYRTLKHDGHFCIVIGDSIIDKKLVRMDKEYKTLLENIGFITEEIFSFNQRKYTKAFTPNTKTEEKQSHIMIFRAVK